MKRSTNCLIPTVALSTTKSGLVSYHQRLATNPLRLRTERVRVCVLINVFVCTKPQLLLIYFSPEKDFVLKRKLA